MIEKFIHVHFRTTTLSNIIFSKTLLIFLLFQNTVFNVIYDKPWTRAGPYIIGMITGYLIHRYLREAAKKVVFLVS